MLSGMTLRVVWAFGAESKNLIVMPDGTRGVFERVPASPKAKKGFVYEPTTPKTIKGASLLLINSNYFLVVMASTCWAGMRSRSPV
jgi:hypothetical protein